MAREFHKLDKDLRRVSHTELAVLHSGRPIYRLGLVLLFMAVVGVIATQNFTGHANIGILVAAMAISAWLGVSIGANDVSNSLSPAVGAGAIGMGAGLLMVAVAEVTGAIIAGADVTQTVTQGLMGDSLGQGVATARMVLAALMAAGCWISLATWVDAPVSTTHSVIGAMAGASVATFGMAAVNWHALGMITIGWIVSPFISGVLAALFLAALRNRVIDQPDQQRAARLWLPRLVAMSTGVLAAMAGWAWHGLPPGVILGLGLLASIGGWIYAHRCITGDQRQNPDDPPPIKRLLAAPLVAAVVVMAFAHGSNDTSNVAAPLGIVLESLSTEGQILPQGRMVLALGGIGIALGVLLFGRNLVQMVGSKITRLNAPRSLCVTLSTAMTVLGFSAAGLPVSTTHIAVGAVFGIGFFREWRDRRLAARSSAPLPPEERRRRQLVRRSYMRMILGAWAITVPGAALLAAALVWITAL